MSEEKDIQYIKFYDPKKPYGWGSNFYKIKPLVIDGETWLTTEAYFQAMKFRGPKATTRSIEYSNLIKAADKPMKTKMLGRQRKDMRWGKTWQLALRKDTRLVNDLIDEYSDVTMRPDWETARIHAMIKALIAKFKDPKLRKEIMSVPDNAVLVEHTKRDKVWGDGGDGSGTNYLGKILTALSWYLKYGDCEQMPKAVRKAIRIGKKGIKKTTKTLGSCTQPTKVVNVKVKHLRPKYEDLQDWLDKGKGQHIYVGRNMEFYVKGATGSKWKNPFSVKRYGREECLRMYEEHIRNHPTLKNELHELQGKTLGCWCVPDACHAQVLARMADEQCNE